MSLGSMWINQECSTKMTDSAYTSPSSDVNIDFMADDNLRLWLPQGEVMGENGKSILLLQQFFISKGVRDDISLAAAKDIYKRQSRKRFRKQLPFKIIGWFLIVFGVVAPLAIFLFGRGFVVVSTFPLAFGCWLVFGVCNKRGAQLDI